MRDPQNYGSAPPLPSCGRLRYGQQASLESLNYLADALIIAFCCTCLASGSANLRCGCPVDKNGLC